MEKILDTESCCSCHKVSAASTVQTLDELDFERGIWSAAVDGDVEKVKRYLADGKDANVLDSAGYTALHYAARNGHAVIVRMLLDAGACVNTQTRSARSTALHKAAYCGHSNVVDLLMKYGANTGLIDTDGNTAYNKAEEQNNEEVCQLLARK